MNNPYHDWLVAEDPMHQIIPDEEIIHTFLNLNIVQCFYPRQLSLPPIYNGQYDIRAIQSFVNNVLNNVQAGERLFIITIITNEEEITQIDAGWNYGEDFIDTVLSDDIIRIFTNYMEENYDVPYTEEVERKIHFMKNLFSGL